MFCRELRMHTGSLRAFLVGGLLAALTATAALGQAERPPIGDFGSAHDAMIFYVAHGPADACGPGCSDWIAAEGTVQWDTHKRLIAILDRQAGRKLPLVIHSWGRSDLNVAASLGRILHERGVDTTDGPTSVSACAEKSEADCFALKRPGGPLDATLDLANARCDLACVRILAGGVHRSLHAETRMVLSGTTIYNRRAANVSDEHRAGLTVYYGDRMRLYFRDMGIDGELVDIVERNSEQHRVTELSASDWMRLHIVTMPLQ